ncbi:cysteine--tRNA ligase [Pseudohoeflea coraliihabitans]|uniref:Cysteine--tRNA ligase n=1 Tax=Pseudohoeflea coraliihabitans TaxID=2860393 RepID=A0ABS6WPJ4_9HYPH|nr:cysteine--tRNA ligase [Pseudohoeflea sp. DP4N28-3]MBW3097891.1 cysteine--tRNA ligase [Pseudohoeflea sp. DP4N28-3]
MPTSPALRFHDTLTRSKKVFEPIDAGNVRLYVCGPTVYDYAHIGNARPAIVFDVLFRLLRHVYGASHVTYVRNITDVDDKINARARRDFPDLDLNAAIARVTEKTAAQYFSDVAALGCLEPTAQPRATAHIDGMVAMIQKLIEGGHAYVASGREGREVLFSVTAMADYGRLSNRKLEDQQAGARIAVEAHKRHPGDFVLWKESHPDEPGWQATFRDSGDAVTIHGRPGWHIECSVMSAAHLGETFDIHGGGLDLIFPHHENEIAQSCCAHGTPVMANLWMHNGFLQVEGQKMSKSLGNFVTIAELLETERFGGRRWPGPVLRLAMLMTHYREPIDFSVKRLEEAENLLAKWPRGAAGDAAPDAAVVDALCDDLNSVAAIQHLHALALKAHENETARQSFLASAALLGLDRPAAEIDAALAQEVEAAIARRLELLAAKNWSEADSIRDALAERGIRLKDGKDPESGARTTSWDVKL